MIQEFFQALLSADWLQQFVVVIMQVMTVIAGIILLPIGALINQLMPGFDNALQNIQPMLDLALTYVGWVVDAFAIPPILLVLLVSYYSFVVVARFSVWMFKLSLNWIKVLR